ncbi:hypothetical protein M514_27264 [Trichuris suis]|uniref:Integrase catalytic domain-containing protein n=1 Tax=Trichuris suis TaxID=68888 RepID=A0A085MTL4_9BILA|nr:hypothetical protein M514_27264 [Trichuris suis]
MESDSTKVTIGTAAALSIKLPQFWAHSPKLWFAQAEAQFALKQVSSSLTKFYYAVAALPDHIASDVDDLLDPEPLNPYEALKAKLLRRFGPTPALQIRDITLPDFQATLACDVSQGHPRPYLPHSFRRHTFDLLHALSHPGIRPTQKLITRYYVWPGINKDVRLWARLCLTCQRTKIQRHVRTPPKYFAVPDSRFDHVHVDIVGPLPPSRGYTYLLTMVDCFTRWPEAVPLTNCKAETVARGFTTAWISRFGLPSIITTDQGRQFQSSLWLALAKFLGIQLAPTSAYHPQANGLIERFHRQLKSALTAHVHHSRQWVDSLPFALLGIRSAVKEDLRHCPAELVYGSSLRLPAVFFSPTAGSKQPSSNRAELDAFFGSVRPTPTRSPLRPCWHVPRGLRTATHVFARVDAQRPPLSPAYDGPFAVVTRTQKTLTLARNGRLETVSVDRVKPAFFSAESAPTDRSPSSLGAGYVAGANCHCYLSIKKDTVQPIPICRFLGTVVRFGFDLRVK